MRKVLFLLALFLLPLATRAANDVDLLWQGKTYTPAFYQGRALWSYQSRGVVVAVPHVSGFGPASLYYKWTQDGTVRGSLSGVGKQSYNITDSALSLSTQIKVDVLNPSDQSLLASASITLKPVPWKAVIYEDNPLYGTLLNKAVASEFDLNGPEVSFLAVPYFSTVTTRTAPAIDYSWTSGGDKRSGYKVTYRVPEGGSGSSPITFRAINSQIIQEPIIKDFLVKFGNEQSL